MNKTAPDPSEPPAQVDAYGGVTVAAEQAGEPVSESAADVEKPAAAAPEKQSSESAETQDAPRKSCCRLRDLTFEEQLALLAKLGVVSVLIHVVQIGFVLRWYNDGNLPCPQALAYVQQGGTLLGAAALTVLQGGIVMALKCCTGERVISWPPFAIAFTWLLTVPWSFACVQANLSMYRYFTVFGNCPPLTTVTTVFCIVHAAFSMFSITALVMPFLEYVTLPFRLWREEVDRRR